MRKRTRPGERARTPCTWPSSRVGRSSGDGQTLPGGKKNRSAGEEQANRGGLRNRRTGAEELKAIDRGLGRGVAMEVRQDGERSAGIGADRKGGVRFAD